MQKKLDQGHEQTFTLVQTENKKKPRFAERLTRNAVMGALVLLVITAVSTGDTKHGSVLTAVQDAIKEDWDEQLGRLTFVGGVLPDAVQVFLGGESELLTAPCFGTIVHAWSESEPYVGYGVYDRSVYPAKSGQVLAIGHGENEERILRIGHDDGTETIYYNLLSTTVYEGDNVTTDTQIGTALKDHAVLLEARRDGIPFNPTKLLIERDAP